MVITTHNCHKAIRGIAVAVAVINLVSCFALDLREWLVYFDPWFVIAVVCPAFVIALPSLPYLLPLADRQAPSLASILALFFVTLVLFFFEALWFVMIAIAVFCRGPDWNFYWPGEVRTPKLVARNYINLSDWVWHHLGQPRPDNPLIRELPGISLVTLHLLIVPAVICCFLRLYADQTKYWRMLALIVCLQLLTALVAKIILYYFFNIKYIITLPPQLFNI